MSITKTKHIVTRRLAQESDREPIEVNGGQIESVREFPYLGSVMANSGRMDATLQGNSSRSRFSYLRGCWYIRDCGSNLYVGG